MLKSVKSCTLAEPAPSMYEYRMNGTVLEVTTEERDLGVITMATTKPTAQCAKAAQTAQAVLGQVARAFHYRDKEVFLVLYKQYIWPHLEFAVQAWAPWCQKDKDLLEKESSPNDVGTKK